jgi:DNA-binding transcriptional LysR family regulator
LEIAVSNELFSLAKRDADVAVRPSMTPPETLVGRKIGIIAQAIYGRKDLIPKDGVDLDIHAAEWVGPDERMAYRILDKWMADQGLEGHCRFRVDTLFGMYAAVRDGAGLAVLPCYLADNDQWLIRFSEAIPTLSTDLWLLTHSDLRKTARIQAFSSFVAGLVKDRGAWLAGSDVRS